MKPDEERTDQGFSVRLERSTGKLLKQLAAKEQRTIKTIVDRAVKLYAARDPKVLP